MLDERVVTIGKRALRGEEHDGDENLRQGHKQPRQQWSEWAWLGIHYDRLRNRTGDTKALAIARLQPLVRRCGLESHWLQKPDDGFCFQSKVGRETPVFIRVNGKDVNVQ